MAQRRFCDNITNKKQNNFKKVLYKQLPYSKKRRFIGLELESVWIYVNKIKWWILLQIYTTDVRRGSNIMYWYFPQN